MPGSESSNMRPEPRLKRWTQCRACGRLNNRIQQEHGKGLCSGCYGKKEARLTAKAMRRATQRLKMEKP